MEEVTEKVVICPFLKSYGIIDIYRSSLDVLLEVGNGPVFSNHGIMCNGLMTEIHRMRNGFLR